MSDTTPPHAPADARAGSNAAAAEPSAFHVMAKPTGARCNLRCDYCFFLSKAELYPDSDFKMPDEVMRAYVAQAIDGQRVPFATIAWQGGEPTLMGVDFFKRSLEAEYSATPAGRAIERTIQTNGVLLDEEWAEFLAANDYLVGLSIDGPREMHDAFRHDGAGSSVFDRVLEAVRLLQRRKVEFNVMCTVNAVNSEHPLEVYRFFRDELGARFIQFIPIVEIDKPSAEEAAGTVTERSVHPEAYGRFLAEIFDEWVRRDVGEVFVQTFDGVLASYVRGYSSLCIFRPTCGDGVALEHNGDLYSCDHFVDRDHLLGNIMETPLRELVDSPKQRAFGAAKSETLPRQCRDCEFLFACNGECPKNRVLLTAQGEPGLNWLCEGLLHFFAHTDTRMRMMADILNRGLEAREVMPMLADAYAHAGRNEPCPCGSDRKFKHCCGRS